MAKSTKKTVQKTSRSSSAKPSPSKKASAVKTVAKKTSAKKTAAEKPVAKKSAVKKSAVKKTAVKKTAVKKTAATKTAKKATVAKPAAQKTVAKKSATKQSVKKTVKKDEKKDATASATHQPRAYGMYDGILVCESPRILPRETPYSEKDINSLRRLLFIERSRLRDILRDLESLTFPGIDGNGNSGVPGDAVDNASDYMDTETSLLLRRDEEEALLQVEAALERLEEGLYGVCMACGVKIGMARLRAKPDAHLCMKCKRIYDCEATRR